MRGTETLKRLFEYKAWANSEFLSAMESLEPAAPSTEIAIRALSHTLVVDEIFAAHMQGRAPIHGSANLMNAPSLEDLAAAVRASDDWYVGYVAGLDDAQLAEPLDFDFTDGAPGRMSREEMLMHLIVHGGLHRGQIGWILTLEGVDPPADGVTTYLHRAEAAERRRTPFAAAAPAPAMAAEVAPAEEGASRLQALTTRLGGGLADAPLGKSVKFDLRGEGFIFLGPKGATNEDLPADLTLSISIDDLRAIGLGKLGAMGAVSSGRLRFSDMGVAMSLQGKLKALFAKTA